MSQPICAQQNLIVGSFLMKFSDRIDAVNQAYRTLLTLYQQGGEQLVHADLFKSALHHLSVVLEELRMAYEEIEQQNQVLLDYHHTLEAERQRYQELFNLAPDGYLVTNLAGHIQEANAAISAMLGVQQSYLIGKPLIVFFPQRTHTVIHTTLAKLNQEFAPDQPVSQTWESEICPRQAPPLQVAITLSYSCPAGDTPAYLRWLIRDITQQKQTEARIHHQAFHDSLTDLPNRALLDTYLPKALAQARRHNTQLALAFLDLDQFKSINDTLGHGVGDELLKQVGCRLQDCLRETDLLVRWGGDEFIVVLADVATLEDVERTCDRIVTSLRPVFTIWQYQLHITTSFGVALFPQDGDTPETLLSYADLALYQAKNQGRNTYRFYR
jgi:diguanylate cyclase (GGDEF)-like protein/PAS domain S-box-containing protein